MATIDDFTKMQGWSITEWKPVVDAEIPGDVPLDLFQNPEAHDDVRSTLLLIGKTKENACGLAWLDARSQWWTIVDGLPFDSTTGKLTMKSANFDGPKPFTAFVDLSIDEAGHLKGQINHPFGGGNSGAFTAEANPIGNGEEPGSAE